MNLWVVALAGLVLDYNAATFHGISQADQNAEERRQVVVAQVERDWRRCVEQALSAEAPGDVSVRATSAMAQCIVFEDKLRSALAPANMAPADGEHGRIAVDRDISDFRRDLQKRAMARAKKTGS